MVVAQKVALAYTEFHPSLQCISERILFDVLYTEKRKEKVCATLKDLIQERFVKMKNTVL